MQTLNTPEKPIVLVIDDDPQILLLCSRSLQRSGFTILTASGVAAAKEATAQRRQVVLLIVDVLLRPPVFRLPGQEVEKAANGIEVLPSLQRLFPHALPLIISAYTKDELVAQGHDAGTTAFLQKPFDPSTLRRTVEALLPGLAGQGGEPTDFGDDVWVD